MNCPVRAALRVRVRGFAALAACVSLSLMPTSLGAQGRPGSALSAPTVHNPRVRDYHVRHLKLMFDVNAKEHSAHGVVTHYLAPLRDNLAAVVLDARDNLKIEACKINSSDTPFQQQNNQLTLTPAAPLAGGKEVAVEITYTMPQTRTRGGANGAGGFRWVDPTPQQPEQRVGFWTQGETNTNSSWVPCYDAPNDKCTSETHVTVPEEWLVIGNGTEAPATHNEAAHTRTFHWTMKQPHSTYLLSLVGGEIDLQKGSWQGVPLYYAVPRGMGHLIPGSFGNTPDMLSWFSTNLGVKYPWPKYAQCGVVGFPGGMENVSATTLGLFGLTDERAGRYPMSSLVSHELGHQWFGDLVTCKDWGDIWLNESFATFMQMFYSEHLDGKAQYEREVEGNTLSYLRSARRFKRALSTNVYSDPDAMFEQGHTYAKGGVILHMLRRELGDKAFFASLRRYLKTNAYQAVETADLEKAIEDETHRDIKPFFDQWIRKPGHPVLDMTWTYDEARKEVVATVKQLQDTADGTPIYNTPLTIGLARGQSGATATLRPASFSREKRQTGNDAIQRQRVVLSQATQEFRLPYGEKPALVLLDPDHDLLKAVPETHLTEADMPTLLRVAPNSVDRNYAARQIGDLGEDEGKIALFAEALKREPGENVGAYLIGKLAATKRESLRPLFRTETQSKWYLRRAAALNALAQLPPTDEDTKLFHDAALSDVEPYPVVIAGLNGLGGAKAANNLDVFAHQIGHASFRDQLASVSIDALANSKQDAVAPTLLLATRPERPTSTRAKAIRAFNELALTSPTVHDALVAFLNDSSPTVQQAAISALSARKDKAALPALKTLAEQSPSQTVKDAAKTAVEELEGK